MSTLTGRTRRTPVPMADGTPAPTPDDVLTDDTLTAAWVRAIALAATGRTRVVTTHPSDLWHGEDADVHAYLSAHPAF